MPILGTAESSFITDGFRRAEKEAADYVAECKDNGMSSKDSAVKYCKLRSPEPIWELDEAMIFFGTNWTGVHSLVIGIQWRLFIENYEGAHIQ